MSVYNVKSLSIYPSYLFVMIGTDGNDWDMNITSGTVTASNVFLMDSNGTGGATFLADSTCIDGGGNTGWNF